MAMTMSLFSLTQLKTLRCACRFHSTPCIALPNLTCFWFHSTSMYLEVPVAHVDAPLIHSVKITFFK